MPCQGFPHTFRYNVNTSSADMFATICLVFRTTISQSAMQENTISHQVPLCCVVRAVSLCTRIGLKTQDTPFGPWLWSMISICCLCVGRASPTVVPSKDSRAFSNFQIKRHGWREKSTRSKARKQNTTMHEEHVGEVVAEPPPTMASSIRT